MQSLSSLIALALMFGAESANPPFPASPDGNDASRNLAAEQDMPPAVQLHEFGGAAAADLPEVWQALVKAYRPLPQSQVRIERRVIIRITPRRPIEGDELPAGLPREPLPQRFKEKGMAKCVPIREIGGAQIKGGNNLLLFMRDRRIVNATLEKGCNARDFYSGFYVERGEDGLICTGRDVLQSRSGAKCELRKLHRLVPVDD